MVYPFRSKFGEDIFRSKGYAKPGLETWEQLTNQLVDETCGVVKSKYGHISSSEIKEIKMNMAEMRTIAGGRYLYYAGRPIKYYNNCFLFEVEDDTREEWAQTAWKNISALMTGGGCGNVYSKCRPEGSILIRTGGTASGPIRLMVMINDIARHIIQGGARRAAEWAGLHWWHQDIWKFLHLKDNPVSRDLLSTYQGQTMDCTNISVIYDDVWKEQMDLLMNIAYRGESTLGYAIFIENVLQAMRTGEPGFRFALKAYKDLILANACTEIISEKDSNVCNLISVNMSRTDDIGRFSEACELSTRFAICGSLTGDVPNDKIRKVRDEDRLLGVGLMGIHEWLLKRGYRYECVPELRRWLEIYKDVTTNVAKELCNKLGISVPKRTRAIAPNGSISILAGTTGGIEPIFSVAYKRTYISGNEGFVGKPVTETIIDDSAKYLINECGIDPDKIETSFDLALDYERRIKFQYDVQKYVDNAISSTINLPPWGTEHNNEGMVVPVAKCILKYCDGLRGLTFYPNGAREGQPLVPISYKDAMKELGTDGTNSIKTVAHDVCSIANKGSCG